MRFRPVLALTVLAGALTGCTSATDPGSVTGIPPSWLEGSAEGWRGSEAFGGDIPVLTREDCLFGDVVPDVLGEDPKDIDSGWGSYGDDPEATNSYRYLCDFWAKDRYAGSLQLIQASDPATADQTVQLFLSQTDTAQQENTVITVQAGQLDVHVLKRWIPTNPQGEYQAMYVDTDNNALVLLEVNSLDDADFAAYSENQVALDLLAALASGT